jgi:steroid delta-isomerase-like uncharacterized protein
MSTQTNKAIAHRHIEYIWNKGRVDLYEELFAENVVHHENLQAGTGVEGMKNGRIMVQQAFPDIRHTIEDEIAEGDKVVVRSTVRGTHQGELMGIPATGKQITMSVVAIYRLDSARIVEVWFFFDQLSMMQQLGAIPMPDLT